MIWYTLFDVICHIYIIIIIIIITIIIIISSSIFIYIYTLSKEVGKQYFRVTDK